MFAVLFLPIIFILSFFLSTIYIEKKTSNIIYIIISIFLVFIVAYRPETMVDYNEYVTAYITGSTRFEYSFNIIRDISRALSNSHIMLMFIYALITIYISVIGIYNNARNIYLSLVVWFSYTFILQDMIQIRQAVVSAIFLYSIHYLLIGKKWRFVIITLFSSIFHISSLAFIPLCFLSTKRKFKWLYIVSIPMAYFLYFFGYQIVYLLDYVNIGFISNLWNSKVSSITATEDVSLLNIRQLVCVGLTFFMWFNIDAISKKYPESILYLKIYTIAVVFFILLFDIPDIASRLNIIYIIIEVLLLPLIYLSFNHKIVKISFYGICTLFFLNYYMRFVINVI